MRQTVSEANRYLRPTLKTVENGGRTTIGNDQPGAMHTIEVASMDPEESVVPSGSGLSAGATLPTRHEINKRTIFGKFPVATQAEFDALSDAMKDKAVILTVDECPIGSEVKAIECNASGVPVDAHNWVMGLNGWKGGTASTLLPDGTIAMSGPVVAPNFSSLRYDMPVTRKKLADVASGAGEFVIGVVGDSHNLAVGGGSGGTYRLNDASRFAPAFIAGRQIAGKYGVPVSDDGWWGWRGISGLVSLNAFDPRWALTGTWGATSSANESLGYGALRATSDGATATYTATRNWNVAEIWMQQNTGATGAAVASATGASNVALTLLAGAPTLQKFTLTKAAVDANPLVITASTQFSAYVGIAAVNFIDTTRPAVRIQNHGMSGRTMSDHIISTRPYSSFNGYQTAGLSADLIIAEALHNSIKAAAQTKATWLASWETFLATLDTASRDILVYIGYPGNYDWATDGTMDDWIAGLKEKLDARQINMVDMRDIYGASWAAGNAEGLMYDNDHPNKRGLALYGAKMARDILSMSAPW